MGIVFMAFMAAIGVALTAPIWGPWVAYRALREAVLDLFNNEEEQLTQAEVDELQARALRPVEKDEDDG